jgi:hypothetical protein
MKREAEIDGLSDAVEAHLDMNRIFEILKRRLEGHAPAHHPLEKASS